MSIATEEVKMIQVHAPTHERLTALRVPGLTYEDVINFALDHLSPDDIAQHYQAWQKEAMQKLSKVSRPLARRKT